MREKVFIIAEAGVNHNGSLELAEKLVDAAAAAGADAVKFQTFTADRLVRKDAAKARYQQQTTGAGETQYAMLKKLELDPAAHERLLARCRSRGITFLSTPFDLVSVALLASLGLETWKIPSGEITNLPYLRAVGKLGRKVILSTGMSYLEEVRDAVTILCDAGTARDNLVVLHCNSQYPTPFADVNLRAMKTLGQSLGLAYGYSDHTLGIEAAVAAAALGAVVIEKHFTLDRTLPGPDHQASLEPDMLGQMVRAIRNIELALGEEEKKPSPSETENRTLVRKSVVAARPIPAGEVFSEENLTAKRPGTGLSPMCWDRLLGRPAGRSYRQDEMIESTEIGNS